MKTHAPVILRLILIAVIVVAAAGIGAVEPPRTVRIIYTGDLMGYLEPCGCGGQKGGGLAKRGTLFAQLRAENPNCVVVDSGNQATVPDRLDLIASVLADLKYDAIGLGALDLRAGPQFFRAFSGARVPVLSADLSPDPSTIPYLIKEIGGVRVGIVSFGGVTLNSGRVNETALRASLYKAFKAARQSSDVLILLDQADIATPEWLTRNSPRLGWPDVVIGGIPQSTLVGAKTCGPTCIVQTSRMAKSAGVVDIEIVPGAALKITPRLLPLSDSMPLDEAIDRRIRGNLNVVSATRPATTIAHVPSRITGGVLPAGMPYFSSETCRECHSKQYDDWKKSGHARAVANLAAANRVIPECLTCHSESYRRTRSVETAANTPHGVECATCHIGSLPHGASRKSVAAKVKVDRKMCLDCHTKDWSPNYDEKAYFPRIVHGAMGTNDTATAGGR